MPAGACCRRRTRSSTRSLPATCCATRAWRAHEADSGLRRVPVIALTATAFAEEREACRTAGMDDHVAPPVDAQQLCATLLRWLHASPGEAIQARSATQP